MCFSASHLSAYCVLSVGRQQVRTDNVLLVLTLDPAPTSSKCTGNVEWLFSTTFDVMAGQQTQEFSISVWLSDAADASAVLLGTYSINIHDISGAILHERQVSLIAPLTAESANHSPPPLLRIQTQLTRHQSHVTEDDFEKLRLIGRGSFGKVFQVRKKVRPTCPYRLVGSQSANHASFRIPAKFTP